jgi:hypothetical protein
VTSTLSGRRHRRAREPDDGARLERARISELRQALAQAAAHEVREIGSVRCHGPLADREAEVRQQRMTVPIDEHVSGRDRAVRDTRAMRCVQRRADVGQQLQRARRVELAGFAQLGQAVALHKLHGHEPAALGGARRVQADHARMLRPFERPDARQFVVVRKQLERHPPSQVDLDRLVDDRPAPAPELALEAEARDVQLS